MEGHTPRSAILNAFQPGTAVAEPDSFAGRRQQVLTLTDALQTIGSVPLIYGHRGLGKTSLALQVERIALGDVELLQDLGAGDRALQASQRLITRYVACTDDVKDLDGLLQLLLNAAETVDTPDNETSTLVDRTTRKKLTAKIFEIETVRKYATAKAKISYKNLSIQEQVRVLSDLISDVYAQPVLYIVDELDRVSAPGLASFVKANSTNSLKFMLVGIATNVSGLLADHRSLERSLVPVEVPLMKQAELREIIEKAISHLEEQGVGIEFSPEAVSALVDAAGGFPWFIHVLGQSVLVRVFDSERSRVTLGDIEAVIAEIVENRFAEQFDDDYKTAVRDSYGREMVLKCFAEWPEPSIPVAEVYQRIRAGGVGNPSAYKSNLCNNDFGKVLITPNASNRGLVRFSNEMFKTYVRLRPAIHPGVDEAIAARRDA